MRQATTATGSSLSDEVWALLPDVTRYVARKFPNLDTQTDHIALDVIVESLDRLNEFSPQRGTLGAWVRRRADWRGLDASRAQKRQPKPPVAPLGQSTISKAEAQDRMGRLTEGQRILLKWHFVDGLPYRAIAEEMDVPYSRVQREVARILQELDQ